MLISPKGTPMAAPRIVVVRRSCAVPESAGVESIDDADAAATNDGLPESIDETGVVGLFTDTVLVVHLVECPVKVLIPWIAGLFVLAGFCQIRGPTYVTCKHLHIAGGT